MTFAYKTYVMRGTKSTFSEYIDILNHKQEQAHDGTRIRVKSINTPYLRAI